ncbi:MAG: c-type cytochrome, partial [Propionivibrio sp.]
TMLVTVLLALAACQPGQNDSSMPVLPKGLDAQATNGARIYFTAASERGTRPSYTGGPKLGGGMMGGGMMGGGMMGGYGQLLTCASCHGPEARGGIHTMHMRFMTAPDIRYSALSHMPEMKERQRPYDIDDFRQSVEQGLHPDGEVLSEDMPRWKMSNDDLNDLFTFLQSLPE